MSYLVALQQRGVGRVKIKLPYSQYTLQHAQQIQLYYQQGDMILLTQAIYDFVFLLWKERSVPLSQDELYALRQTLELVLYIMSDPACRFDEEALFALIPYAGVLGNALKLAGLGNSDAYCKKLDGELQQLFLLSLHNEYIPDLKPLADRHPTLLSLWWDKLYECALPLLDEAMHKRAITYFTHPVIQQHFTYFHGSPSQSATTSNFFYCSYIDGVSESRIKPYMNQAIESYVARRLSVQPSIHEPDFQTVVVISRTYYYPHVVYRSLATFMKPLRQRYRMVLAIFDDMDREISQPDGFDEYYRFSSYDECVKTICEDIKPGIVFFTDIGMFNDSLILSNIRMAPIQVTGYGHPITTYSPHIDYFIASADAEHLDKAQQDYSEKLVLIQGLAATALTPDYEPSLPYPKDLPEIYISLAWSSHKINRGFLERLLPLFERTGQPVQLVLTGLIGRGLRYLLLKEELDALIGPERYKMFPMLKREHYYPLIESCHFGIDSHPFGGYNRIIDSLHCARPIIVREGDHFVNRAGAHMLRQLGLEELVATDDEQMLAMAVKLVEDEDYRTALAHRIQNMNIEESINATNPPDGYLKAFNALIQDYHAGGLSNRTPIVVEP